MNMPRMLRMLTLILNPKTSLIRTRSMVSGGLTPGLKFVAKMFWMVP